MRPEVRKSVIFFVTFYLLFILPSWAGDSQTIEVYNEVFNNEEEYLVKKGDRLPSLAQRRALRLQVLTKQNNLKNLNAVKPGSTLNLSHSFILPGEVIDGLVVNLAELTVYHFQNGVFLRRYPLAAGTRGWETPTGSYKILNKIKNPVWRVPVSIQWEMYDRGQNVITEVPPGPKNPLGDFWMATSAEGVGFHATLAPWSVGRYASHGCFRMLKDHIEELFNRIEVGTPVKIIYKPVKMAVTPDNRIFLEVHGDYYQRLPNYFQKVQDLAKNQKVGERIDWQKVKQVIKERDGIAMEVTKKFEPAAAAADSSLGNRLYSGEIVKQPADPNTSPNQRRNIKQKPKSGS